MFIDSELKEINPIYESFKRIKEVRCGFYEDALEILNTLKHASIQEIEHISFRERNVLKDEKITNQLLNYKIHTLHLSNFSLGWISNQAFENCSKINPQKLHQPILNILKLFNNEYWDWY